MGASGDGKLDIEGWNKYIRWMADKKLSWVTLSVSDKDESCSVLNTSEASDGNWAEKDLKESGIITREYLRTKNKTGM